MPLLNLVKPQSVTPASPSTQLVASNACDVLNLQTVIQRHIHFVLIHNHGNKLKTARQLGISRSTLYRMLDHESAISQ